MWWQHFHNKDQFLRTDDSPVIENWWWKGENKLNWVFNSHYVLIKWNKNALVRLLVWIRTRLKCELISCITPHRADSNTTRIREGKSVIFTVWEFEFNPYCPPQWNSDQARWTAQLSLRVCACKIQSKKEKIKKNIKIMA